MAEMTGGGIIASASSGRNIFRWETSVKVTGDTTFVDFWMREDYFRIKGWELAGVPSIGYIPGRKPSWEVGGTDWKKKMSEMMMKIAQRIVELYHQIYQKGGFEPKWEELCNVTLKLREGMPQHTTKTGLKGGTPVQGIKTVLVHTGRMASSVRIVHGRSTGFVGAQGMDSIMIVLAEDSAGYIFLIHEYGMDIAITPKMRGFLSSLGWHIKADKTFIHIPKRPILAPLIQRLNKELAEMLQKHAEEWRVKREVTPAEKVMWSMSREAERLLSDKTWDMATYQKFVGLPTGTEKYQMVYNEAWPYKFKPFQGYSGWGYTGGS